MYKNKLKEFRKEKKLTQKEMAQLLNIAEVTYTNYENEYYIIPINYLIMLVEHFEISIDYLFGLSNHYAKTFEKTNPTEAGKRLKEFRKRNNLTQEKLSNILNTTKSVICGYEKGKFYIATPFLYDICKKYNISADYLLGRI